MLARLRTGFGCSTPGREETSPDSGRGWPALIHLGVKLHAFHFFDTFYGDCARATACVHRSADAHKFSEKWHQLLILAGIRHGGGHWNVDVAALGQNDQRRAALRALLGALKVEIRGASFVVLNRAGDVSHQAFDGHFRLGWLLFRVVRGLAVCCGCRREDDTEEENRPVNYWQSHLEFLPLSDLRNFVGSRVLPRLPASTKVPDESNTWCCGIVHLNSNYGRSKSVGQTKRAASRSGARHDGGELDGWQRAAHGRIANRGQRFAVVR